MSEALRYLSTSGVHNVTSLAYGAVRAATENATDAAAHAAEGGHHIDPIRFWNDLFALMGFLCIIFIAGKAVQLIGGPSLIGEMIAGIVLGPHVLNIAPEPRSMILIGDFGLCLLMLEAGLEIDVSLLKQVGLRGMLIAFTGTVLPFSIAIGTAMGAFGFSFKGGFSAGAALQPTSLAIVLGVLKKGGALNTPTGQLIVAAAAIDDVIAVILLSEVEALANPSVKSFLIPVVAALAFLLVIGALAVFVIPKVLSDYVLPKVPPQHREYLVLGCILTTAVGLQAAANAARSSYLLGALLAGLSFSTIRSSEHVWEMQVKRALHWCIKIFFAATIGFEVPVRSFWSLKVFYQAAAFMGPIIIKFLVGLYSVPLTRQNILTVGTAMCARGEFGFIIALRARTLNFLTQDQYASLMLPLLIAAIAVPFLLKAILSATNKTGRAIFDEAEFDTAVDAATHFKPVYYQMRLKCFNSFGLMNEILSTAAKENLLVMDARIHSIGNYADDVFYFKDLILKAPVKATNNDEASKKALKEVQDRLDDLYETFLQRAKAFAVKAKRRNANGANGTGGSGNFSRRLSIDLSILRRSRSNHNTSAAENAGDGEEVAEVDLIFVRWLPGMVDQDGMANIEDDNQGGFTSEATDSLMFKQIVRQLESEEKNYKGPTSDSEPPSSKATTRNETRTSKVMSNPCGRRASIEMLVAAELEDDDGPPGPSKMAAVDQQIREGLLVNAARDFDKIATRNKKHAGYSRFNPTECERAADNAADGGPGMGYTRRSIDMGSRPGAV